MHPQNPDASRLLADQLGVHRFTAQALINRRLETAGDARRFLNPADHDFDDPLRIRGMEKAVERLRRAIAQQETIRVFGDSDVDGITAAVIASEAIQQAGGSVDVRSSNRIDNGYGLPDSAVADILAAGVRVVVLVDCGTNQPEAIRTLAQNGVDTLILDHHAPLDEPAEPYAMVNAFCAGGDGRELCSAGLAFKLAQSLLVDAPPEQLTPYLDLAAIGTLADCAPLRGESRLIVFKGLACIANSLRPGLRRLCEAVGLDAISPDAILRKIVPKLNASGRLGDCSAARQLLGRHSPESHEMWMGSVDAAHEKTRSLQRRIVGEAMAQASRLNFAEDSVVVVAGAGWHRGLMGPLASQLAQSHNRPAIAIALEDGVGTGSARSVPSISVLEVLRRCSEHLVRFGGHAQACGLTVSRERLTAFRQAVNQAARELIAQQPSGTASGRVLECDLDLQTADLTEDWTKEWQRFAPFGMGNPEPVVVLRRIRLEVKSPRRGWVREGERQIPVQGSIPTMGMDTPLDMAAVPMIERGELTLRLRDVRLAAAL